MSDRINFLIQSLAICKDEIRTFADEPEIKEMAIENYKDYYSELKSLMKKRKLN